MSEADTESSARLKEVARWDTLVLEDYSIARRSNTVIVAEHGTCAADQLLGLTACMGQASTSQN
jgi:hypothetical protein